MTITATPTAAWSLDRLVTSLARSGWGDSLDGPALAGVRRVLRALSDLLPWEAAEGRVTRAQIADAAGMTPKWAGVCLARLEALGLVSWHRGWLDKGRPRPGWIRVSKTHLAGLVRAARGYLDGRRAARREATQARIGKLRRNTVPPWRRSKAASQHIGSEFPPSHSRKDGAPATGRPAPSPTLPEGDETMARCSICGQDEARCELSNRKVGYYQGHRFTPAASRHQALIAPLHELRRPRPEKQRGGWRQLAAEFNRPAHPTLDLEEPTP